MSKPLVFISCGQSNDEEIAVGEQVRDLLNSLGYEAFFAQNQNSPRALNEYIFKALNRCSALIVILHPRGKIVHSANDSVLGLRASVWIEQEIAIASFISATRDEEILLRGYVHEALNSNWVREGVRSFLMLNPMVFRSAEDVVNHIKDDCATWNLIPTDNKLGVEAILSFKIKQADANPQITQWAPELVFSLKNNSFSKLENYGLEVALPRIILGDPGSSNENSTSTHSFYLTEVLASNNQPIFQGREREVFSRQCVFAERNLGDLATIFEKPIVGKYYAEQFPQLEVAFRVDASELKKAMEATDRQFMKPTERRTILTVIGESVGS